MLILQTSSPLTNSIAKGALDALRDVAKQYQRNRELWSKKPDEMPVYGTQVSRFNDDGVTALYQVFCLNWSHAV